MSGCGGSPVSRSVESGGGGVPSLGLTGRPDDGSAGRGEPALPCSATYTPASRESGDAPAGLPGCASLWRLRGR